MKRIIENGITVLMADEGKILVSGDISSTLVYLGKEDNGLDWKEIDYVGKDDIVEDLTL